MAYYVKGKGWFESSGVKMGSARQVALNLARTYGFENDRKSFTRLVIESRVAIPLLNEQFNIGRKLKENETQKAPENTMPASLG